MLPPRESGTLKLFVDGVVVQPKFIADQYPYSRSAAFYRHMAAVYSGYEYRFQGYITDFRFVKGTQLYTALIILLQQNASQQLQTQVYLPVIFPTSLTVQQLVTIYNRQRRHQDRTIFTIRL